MKKRKKRAPGADSEGVLPYRIDPEPLGTVATSFSGLPLVAELFRALGLEASCRRHLRIKERERGLTEAQFLEIFVLMFAAGGDCVDDLARLREDPALPELLGYPPPPPETGRLFLKAFHDEAIMAQRVHGTAWIPPESLPLKGLREVCKDAIRATYKLLPGRSLRTATLDHDATIIESSNREALPHYKGGRGYQPSFIIWKELDLIMADEFRDGNVNASFKNLPLIQEAFSLLPNDVKERYFRSDSACYEHVTMAWLKQNGVGFAISAKMSTSLRRHIEAIPEESWHPHDHGRQFAEVPLFVPSGALKESNTEVPNRYIAIRKTQVQLRLPNMPDEEDKEGEERYWAVVTNLPWRSKKVLAWHREKAGTIEQTHRDLKDELGLGTLPSGRFGVDAAWARLNVLAYNLLSMLRRTALPPALKDARPKRLRYEVFQLAGLVIHHARTTFLRIAAGASRIAALIQARYQVAGAVLALAG